jgi:hypothetical protein
MSIRQLQLQAYREWNTTHEIKCHYQTFEYYWWERYARVYRLPSRIIRPDGPVH